MKLSRKQRAAEIQKILDFYFLDVPVPLKHQDSFTLLIAVLLSAQCTDERVNKITPALFAIAGTPQSMAKQSIANVEKIIKSCGLGSQKSKAIVNLSKIVLEKYNGAVPQTFDDLESLPGVGHKTASVVMSQAFGQPAFPVDTHIHRLAHRWGLSDGSSVEKTEEDLKKLFPKETWNKLHLQMIYFGRQYCQARSHNVSQCPICSKLNVSL